MFEALTPGERDTLVLALEGAFWGLLECAKMAATYADGVSQILCASEIDETMKELGSAHAKA